ncbi:MAG TPA: hypothetical protein VLA64_06365 [Azonexus sp.]|nr:hypothetical protein [Azonexus sp.]
MNEENPSRRTVLRAAMAAGCSLWMPIAMGAGEAKKATQASVQYQAKPNGAQKCATCLNFIAGSNTCKVVEGQVSPEGWCKIWVKKV